MHKPDPVETILARLMPTALSDEGQRDIEAMLDELAGTPAETLPKTPWFRRPVVHGIAATGIAAAIALLLTLSPDPQAKPVVAYHPNSSPEVVLVGESKNIQSMSEEGWQENPNGSAMRALRMQVVEENRLLDKETGIVMLVSQPREEYLLVPVSSF